MELKASEFRIGNLLYQWRTDIPFEVGIDDLKIIQSGESKARPIPLTEEWHNKFGVYKNGFNSFEYELNDIFSFGIKIVFSGDYVFLRQGNKKNMHEDDIVSVWNKDLTKRDMYVHEFQNLYFSLTNKELEIKM